MTAIKSTGINGVQYMVIDQGGNQVIMRQGSARFSDGAATIQLLLAGGVGARFTATQAGTVLTGNQFASTFTDADSNIYKTTTFVPVIAGGQFESAGSGQRLFMDGLFADLTSTNLTDMNTVFTAFSSSSVVS